MGGGVRAGIFPAGSERHRGLACRIHARGMLGIVVGLAQAESTGSSASLHQVAAASYSLLRLCHGSVPCLTPVVGSADFAPHSDIAVVRHWFGAAKNSPALSQLLRVLSLGSPVSVARRGHILAEMACDKHLSFVPHDDAIHHKIFHGGCARPCVGL